MQQIQSKTGTYIWWNHSKSFLRIYGSDKASIDAKNRIDKYIRDTLRNEKHTITLDIPSGKHSFKLLKDYNTLYFIDRLCTSSFKTKYNLSGND